MQTESTDQRRKPPPTFQIWSGPVLYWILSVPAFVPQFYDLSFGIAVILTILWGTQTKRTLAYESRLANVLHFTACPLLIAFIGPPVRATFDYATGNGKVMASGTPAFNHYGPWFDPATRMQIWNRGSFGGGDIGDTFYNGFIQIFVSAFGPSESIYTGSILTAEEIFRRLDEDGIRVTKDNFTDSTLVVGDLELPFRIEGYYSERFDRQENTLILGEDCYALIPPKRFFSDTREFWMFDSKTGECFWHDSGPADYLISRQASLAKRYPNWADSLK